MTRALARNPAEPHSSARTIAAILLAAETEFGAHGINGARMERIARGAGVTTQLVHHYFGSKAALYMVVLERLSQLAVSEIVSHNYADVAPIDGLRLLLNSIFDLHHQLPNLARVALDQTIHHGAHVSKRNKFRDQVTQLMTTLKAILTEGTARGDFIAVANPDLFCVSAITLTTSCFYNPIILQTCLGEDELTTDRLEMWRSYSADLLLRTVVAPPPAVPPVTG